MAEAFYTKWSDLAEILLAILDSNLDAQPYAQLNTVFPYTSN